MSDQPLRVEIGIDREQRLVRLTLAGLPATGAVRAAIDQVMAQLGDATGFDVYSDHRGLTAPLAPDQLHALVAHLEVAARAVRGCRWAVVVGSQASYGMIRMLAVHAERVPMRVEAFWDPAEAEAWLREGRGPGAVSGER